MLGVGLSIDYSMLIVSRFIELRTKYKYLPVNQIIIRIFKTTGFTVVSSAVLVGISVSGGLAFHEYYITSMCTAMIVIVICAALGSNFFLYAQLSILDHKIELWKVPRFLRSTQRVCAVPVAKTLVNTNDINTNDIQGDIELSNNANDHTIITSSSDHQDAIDMSKDINDVDDGEHALVSDEQASRFWYLMTNFVIENRWMCFIGASAFLIGWSAYFLKVVLFNQIDTTILAPKYVSRQVYDYLNSEFSLYGHQRLYVYLQTTKKGGVLDPTFLASLHDFVNKVQDVDTVVKGGVFSMVSTGLTSYSLANYLAMYSNMGNYVKSLAYPLGLTDLSKNTYVAVALNDKIPCSVASRNAVENVRSLLKESFSNVDINYKGVGGPAAQCYDLYSDVYPVIPVWIGVLLGGTFIIMLFMSKSLVIPIKAMILSVLSLFASLGILVCLFPMQTSQSVMNSLSFKPTGYIDMLNTIFIFSISYGLTVDYEVFVIGRLLEEYKKTRDNKVAVMRSIMFTGPIITSCAIMLGIVVFSFIGSDVLLIKEIGVGTAIAIVLDAGFVRIFLVPSFLLLLEDYLWYCPKPLFTLIELVVGPDEVLEDLSQRDQEYKLLHDNKTNDNDETLK